MTQAERMKAWRADHQERARRQTREAAVSWRERKRALSVALMTAASTYQESQGTT